MELQNLDFFTNPFILSVIFVLIIWDAYWKLIGLWKSARNKHLGGFVCIAIFNTVGILPIIYLLTNKTEKSSNE